MVIDISRKFGPDLLEGKGTFTVPKDYKHDTQIDSFGKKTRKLKTTYYYNDDFTSKNFAKVTNKLVPGKSYRVKMFSILEQVESDDCLSRLKAEPGNILVGGQGITLLQEHQPDIFPTGKYMVSFDEKSVLWKDADGDRRVPYVGRGSGGDWEFDLGCFEYSWDSDVVVLCFCDLEEPSEA